MILYCFDGLIVVDELFEWHKALLNYRLKKVNCKSPCHFILILQIHQKKERLNTILVLLQQRRAFLTHNREELELQLTFVLLFKLFL